MGIIQDIYGYIKSGETQNRNLGLEIEHFVVDPDGFPIRFDEITSLISKVGREIKAEIIYAQGHPVGYVNEDYSISLEPSCQFEISISPYPDLSVIERIYREFRSLWEPVLYEHGYRFATKGLLPLIESGAICPDDLPLSPKKRYQYMDAYFRKSGKYGKYMMRASASAQVSVDYGSEADLVRKMRVLQIISPILMIMMENKTDENATLPGVSGKTHLLRTQIWDDLDPVRTGFFPGSFDADFGYMKVADVVYHTPLILLTDNGTTVDVGNKTAEDLVKEKMIPAEETDEIRRKKLVEHFLSMGFFHFRIKNYIEIRIADSVPIEKALGYAALLKGIVYSENSLKTLEKELADIDDVSKIQDAVQKIEREGMRAVVYHNLAADQWVSCLVELAKAGLPDHERAYLNNV